MEFWIGLTAGMHLGKVIADYLAKFVEYCGLLDSGTIEEIKEIEEEEKELFEAVDGMTDAN